MMPFVNRGHEIDYRYMAQNVVASDKDSGVTEITEDSYRATIEDHIRGMINEGDWLGLEGDDAKAFDTDVRRTLLDPINEFLSDWTPEQGIRNTIDYRWKSEESGVQVSFEDAWEWRFERYTHRFVWACHAVSETAARYYAERDTRPAWMRGADRIRRALRMETA